MTEATHSQSGKPVLPPAEIAAAYRRLKSENQTIRARDAAEQVGVSEGELVASRVGEGVIRLVNDPGAIFKALPALGVVMALTRNETVVHEKVGQYENITIGAEHGLVLNREIDLRLFLKRWAHAFAVTEETMSGTRQSLQFFDKTGLALHKIYMREESDWAAFDALKERFADDVQLPGIVVEPADPPAETIADADLDRDAFHARWAGLEDTHQFVGLLRDFKLARRQALRLIGSDFVDEMPASACRTMLEAAAKSGASIMCFVGNHGCIQIHTGPVERIEPRGPWINVLDPGFNLHLREDRIGSAYVVRKPTTDGIVTSLEVYDTEENLMAQFFGERKPSETEHEDWRAILADLARLH